MLFIHHNISQRRRTKFSNNNVWYGGESLNTPTIRLYYSHPWNNYDKRSVYNRPKSRRSAVNYRVISIRICRSVESSYDAAIRLIKHVRCIRRHGKTYERGPEERKSHGGPRRSICGAPRSLWGPKKMNKIVKTSRQYSRNLMAKFIYKVELTDKGQKNNTLSFIRSLV